MCNERGHYRLRNCPRFHPDRIDPEWTWAPTYKGHNGALVTINEAAIPECPVSYIGHEARSLVTEYMTLAWARKATGAQPEKLTKWPARKVDAFVLLEIESEGRQGALSQRSNDGGS